ncbi:MAG TPA: Crp/Fnr family transcriptional regulator [Blastocatellia bacterium]|nr:Crp/Fnr family transcriptional regulator [Blastocatellia bacterium]
MTLSDKPRTRIENRILAALPTKVYNRLVAQMERVPLPFAEVLYEPGDTIEHVYFPNDSIVSLLSTVEDRSTLEVGIIGNEGMVGVSVLLGVKTSPNRALVQGEGSAMRMKAAALRKEVNGDGSLQRLLHRNTHALMTQIAQSAACNRFHQVEARLARWLLMTHDRIGSDEFRLTQLFLSDMLGVRREGVTNSATVLQRNKLITYSRGHITILNRAGLEATACKCYSIIKAEYDSFLGV